MKNEIQIFKSDEFGQVRTTTINGEPWFALKDVCNAFGEQNYRRVAQRIDDEEKGVSQIDTPGGTQSMTVVNEAGLYSALFAMQPEKARGVSEEYVRKRQEQLRKFKRWVTSEVLPSIRKTGSYTVDPLQKQRLEVDLNNSRANVAALWLEIGSLATPEYKQVCSSYASSVLAGGKEVIPLPECKIDRYYSAAEIADALGITANRVGKIANQHGLKTAEYGKWFFDKSPYSNKEVQTFRYTRKAVDAIRKLV